MRFLFQELHGLEDAQRNFEQLQGLMPSQVTALPQAAADGQMIDYVADATNGMVWRFRYRAASTSTHRWEFVGGSPLTARVSAAESTTSTTYAALATPGPSVTVPLAGDFMVAVGSYLRNNTATASVFHSFDVGATGAVDTNAVQFDVSTANLGVTGTMWSRQNGLAASTALVSKYRGSAGTALFQNRWLQVTPVRVG